MATGDELEHKAAVVHEVDRSMVDLAPSFKEALWTLALQSRLLIGAHQCAASYIDLPPPTSPPSKVVWGTI